ncbi:hypothetical protein ABES02_25310 [Neobacillus pocheonensis]
MKKIFLSITIFLLSFSLISPAIGAKAEQPVVKQYPSMSAEAEHF